MKKLLSTYQSLQLDQVVDYEKFNRFAITHHSTQIEGSTLSEIETRLLLEEDLTPKGKPLSHSLMVKDHYQALLFTVQEAKSRREISPAFICAINSAVLRQTGSTYRTLFGDIDSSQGQYRKSNVSAGNRFFVHFEKVELLVKQLCDQLQDRLLKVNSVEDQLFMSFDAHFDLVTIHPFYDGNGRTSRLLMNYIQAYFGLPLAIVFAEDKVAYFKALEESREKEDLSYFRSFMVSQYRQFLTQEIELYRAMERGHKKGPGFSMVF